MQYWMGCVGEVHTLHAIIILAAHMHASIILLAWDLLFPMVMEFLNCNTIVSPLEQTVKTACECYTSEKKIINFANLAGL